MIRLTKRQARQILRRLVRKQSTGGYGGGYFGTGHRWTGPTAAPPRILVTGAAGQIGSEFVPALRHRYGVDNVIASDVKIPTGKLAHSGPFVYLDVTSFDQMARVALENRIEWIVHFAALLSAVGERQPALALKINNQGLENALEVARLNGQRVYVPSSIAAFGPTTPSVSTPNLTIMRPTTVYGITKVYAELLGEYYHGRYGVDFRSIRYPGIISSESAPGGGTTDYAVEIFTEALLEGKYKCFLAENTMLPMMYMPDCIRATTMLMEADHDQLRSRVYNLTGFSFTPKQIAETIKQRLPEFEMTYQPDFRQEIAESWPKTIDDSDANKDWGWEPEYGLQGMSDDMLLKMAAHLGLPAPF